MQSSTGTRTALPALIWIGISGMDPISPATARAALGIIPHHLFGMEVLLLMPEQTIVGILTLIVIGAGVAH